MTWQTKLQTISSPDMESSWGPDDEDLRDIAALEVTGCWDHLDSTDSDVSDRIDDDVDDESVDEDEMMDVESLLASGAKSVSTSPYKRVRV